MTATATMNKRDAVLSCFEDDPELINKPATVIVKAIKQRHGITIGDTYCSMIRKEYRESRPTPTASNGMKKHNAETGPVSPSATELVVVDVQMVMQVSEIMHDISDIAKRVGGMENLILLTTKLHELAK